MDSNFLEIQQMHIYNMYIHINTIYTIVEDMCLKAFRYWYIDVIVKILLELPTQLQNI